MKTYSEVNSPVTSLSYSIVHDPVIK